MPLRYIVKVTEAVSHDVPPGKGDAQLEAYRALVGDVKTMRIETTKAYYYFAALAEVVEFVDTRCGLPSDSIISYGPLIVGMSARKVWTPIGHHATLYEITDTKEDADG